MFARLRARGIDSVALDFEDAKTYRPALEGAGAVFFVWYANPRFAEVSGHLAEAAKAAGVRRFVKLSAYGADFAPEFLIAAAHRESELAIEAAGITYTHLRSNVWMQNLVNYHEESIMREGALYLGQGAGRVSFIDVRDVGRAAVVALTKGGHGDLAYTLTGTEAFSYDDVAAVLSRVSGRRIRYVALSEEEARRRALARGAPPFIVEINLNMDEFGRKGGFARITREFAALTGGEPIAFERFATENIEAFGGQNAARGAREARS